jgi:hypothetical protein
MLRLKNSLPFAGTFSSAKLDGYPTISSSVQSWFETVAADVNRLVFFAGDF